MDKIYYIIRNVFPGLSEIVAKELTKEEATIILHELNKNEDAFEWFQMSLEVSEYYSDYSISWENTICEILNNQENL